MSPLGFDPDFTALVDSLLSDGTPALRAPPESPEEAASRYAREDAHSEAAWVACANAREASHAAIALSLATATPLEAKRGRKKKDAEANRCA